MRALTLSKSDRAALFTETAARRALLPVVVEKDYWVCVVLGVLFDAPQPVDLIFKGGTSLSKGYGLIDRFSEDVDLAFDRVGLGFVGERDPEAAGLSAKKQKALIKALGEAAVAYIQGDFLAATRERLAAVLPSGDWTLEPDPDDHQTLLFAYPASLDQTLYASTVYVRPVVRLEFGARSDHAPATMRTITSFATEELGDLAELDPINVPMLAAERTFWEKASLLHAEAHREQPREDARAMSRHLYDLVRLSDSEFGVHAMVDDLLFARVVAHKTLYFASAQARYDLCVRGSLRLLPVDRERRRQLEADYIAMQPMFFADPPSFGELVEKLTALEERINRGG